MAELGQMALHIVQYFKGGPTSDHLMHVLHHFSRDGQVLAALHQEARNRHLRHGNW